jgi:hypothetical protein
MMAATLPPPKVPDLGADNAIDLDRLGSDDLETIVDYPGIAEGDHFWPQWWGCTASGEAVDNFSNLIVIGPGDLTPEGMPVQILNNRMRELDQGWVFYSYKLPDSNTPDEPGEESLRRFFYVGKRASSLLPVPQIKESHELALDWQTIEGTNATVVTPPYSAMSVGDTVTFMMDMYWRDNPDSPWMELSQTAILEADQIGKPLEWGVSKTELEANLDGFVLMRYSVEYANPTVISPSFEQKVDTVPPVKPLLPPLEIKGFSEDELDPELFPDGITLAIKPYPGIQMGDDLLVYFVGGQESAIKTLRVDASSIDSETLEVTVEQSLLSANIDHPITLMYQFARLGAAGTSERLDLNVAKSLKLPAPKVERATPDGDNKGFLRGESTTTGVYILLPDDAEIGVGNQVQMHWQGHGTTYVADPMVGNEQRFYIPPSAIPANLGKRLNVVYKVTPPGAPGKESKIYDLEIKDIASGWPVIQITDPPSPGNEVSLAQAVNGLGLKLHKWMYMQKGQRLRIYISGVPAVGDQETKFDVRTGDKEVVSEAEYQSGEVEVNLPLVDLKTLKVGMYFRVFVGISFDGGESYKAFQSIAPQLVP